MTHLGLLLQVLFWQTEIQGCGLIRGSSEIDLLPGSLTWLGDFFSLLFQNWGSHFFQLLCVYSALHFTSPLGSSHSLESNSYEIFRASQTLRLQILPICQVFSFPESAVFLKSVEISELYLSSLYFFCFCRVSPSFIFFSFFSPSFNVNFIVILMRLGRRRNLPYLTCCFSLRFWIFPFLFF